MITLTLVLVALFAIVAAVAKKQQNQEDTTPTPNSLLAASFGMSEFGDGHCDRCDQEKYIRRYFHQQHGWILSLCDDSARCGDSNQGYNSDFHGGWDHSEEYCAIRLIKFPNGDIKRMGLTSPLSEWKEIN